jgi:hypothetical protein
MPSMSGHLPRNVNASTIKKTPNAKTSRYC